MSRETLLEKIERDIKTCTKCDLCQTALNAVPGEGNTNADIVFIGEAPGANEDKTGRPFVGRAGGLLEKLIVKIGYERKDVWIGNIIKHRPPKNRDPFPTEIRACEPYLSMQLRLIQPKLVVTLGRFAMNYFHPTGKITNDHGKLIKLNDYNVYPVYHPAAALRKKAFAEALAKDFIRIPKILKELEAEENDKDALKKEGLGI